MAKTNPIEAIGFNKQGQVKPLAPLKPLNDTGMAIGFDQPVTGPNPIEGPTPSKQYTEGYLPGTSLEEHLSQQQDGWDQFGNFTAQTGIEALAGTIEAASYLGDFQQHLDKLRGEEEEYSNWLGDSMKSLKESGRTDWAPVYVSEKNKSFQPASAEWWAHNGGQGLGSTLSLLIPGMGVAKLSKLAGLGTLGQTISATLASRYAESTMEANQVFQELSQQGKSKEEAGAAASKVWNSNWVFALQDFTQFSSITKGFNALSKGSKGLGFGQLIKQMASEGLEEAGQFVVSEEAKRTATNANVDYFGAGFGKRLNDYIQDDEFKTSTLLGALGGGVFHAAGKVADTVMDVEQGRPIKERLQSMFGRGIQKEVASSTDDKITTQAITNIDFAQTFSDAFNKDTLPQYKEQLEELKKTPDLVPEARQAIDAHIVDVDNLLTEEAKLRNSNIPQDLHKPILLLKLQSSQNLALNKQADKELDATYQKAVEQGLDPALLDLKKLMELTYAYGQLAKSVPEFQTTANKLLAEFHGQKEITQIAFPQLDIIKALRTQLDDKLSKLSFQSVSTKEKKELIQSELDSLTTPEGIAAYRAKETQRKVDQESLAVLNNPAATKEEILQAEQNTQDSKIKTELAKKFQDLINKDKQANLDQLADVIDTTIPETDELQEYDPSEEYDVPDFDPNLELVPDDFEEPEVDFAGGITQEQANRWGLTKKETEDLVSQVDVETRQPKAPTKELVEKHLKTEESIKERTTVSSVALNINSKKEPILYRNRYTGETAKPEQVYAIDNTTGQLLANTPRVQAGMEVIVKLEKDFPWDQRSNPTYTEDNYTVNIYLEGVTKPISSLRSADNKYMSKEEQEHNRSIRKLLSQSGSIKTTIASKNIGSPRVDNTLKSIEILESDFMLDNEGKWRMQVLPHYPILGLVDHNGNINVPNAGAMRDIDKNSGILDRVQESIDKYFTQADIAKLSGKTMVFRTAPDGSLRAIGLDYREMTDAERGWVRNNLAELINKQDFNTLKEVIHIPTQPSGVYKHTDDKGRPKKPDVTKLDRQRFHMVSTSQETLDFLIPILGKNKQKLWIAVQNQELDNLLNNREFKYRIIDGAGNRSPVNTEGRERIVEAFDKVLAKQFKNVNEANLNSEIQYTDPVTNNVYPTFYEYLVKTNTVQTKLKGSLTIGTGEDSSYSFNQVSLYLDPNPSKTEITLTENTLTIKDEPLSKPEDTTKSDKKPEEQLKEFWESYENDEPLLKPASVEGHTFNIITERELQWFRDHIGEEYLNIASLVDSFIAKNGIQAFGQYYNSLVTIGQFSPEGTAYHEAGHFLFDPQNGVVTAREKERILDEASEIFNIKRSNDFKNEPKLRAVDYKLKALEILQSPKAEEIFKKGEKNNWKLEKILTELNVPKEQQALLLGFADPMGYHFDRESLITDLAQHYSYIVEVETTTENTYNMNDDLSSFHRSQFSEEELEEMGISNEDRNPIQNTQHYSNLTVPGGTNYTENEIKVPNITPSIKGHAAFSSDQGIGWFRSDERQINEGELSIEMVDRIGGKFDTSPTIEEFERNREPNLGQTNWKVSYTLKDGRLQIEVFDNKEEAENLLKSLQEKAKAGIIKTNTRRILEIQSDLFQKGREREGLVDTTTLSIQAKNQEEHNTILEGRKDNQFLQLLNKNNNWVSFFIKSIIQDSAAHRYEKVLFPTGNTASKVEGMGTLEEFMEVKNKRLQNLEKYREDYKNPDLITKKGFRQYVIGGNFLEQFPTRKKAEEEVQKIIQSQTNEIEQIKKELERVQVEGFGALAPIFKFYEENVGNILKKLYKDNIKKVKDEYNNEWYELTLKEEHKGTVKLKSPVERELSGDEQIEEKIMEEFEKYRLSDGKYKPKVVRAKGFFRRLLQLIKNLLGFKSPLQKLFERFDNVRPSDIRVRSDLEDITEPKYKLLPGFWNAAHQKEAVQSFASEVMRYAQGVSRVYNVDLLNFFTKKEYVDEALSVVKGRFKEDYERIAAIPRNDRSKQDSLRYFSYLAMGIAKSTIGDEQQLNGEYEDVSREGLSPIEGFKTKVLKDLARWGFRVRLSDGTVYETTRGEDEQDEKQELRESDEAERLYGIDSTQINPADSLSQRVRLFLSTIPEPRTDKDGRPTGKTRTTIFGTPKFLDFKRVDASMTLKLVNAIDPLARLELLSKSDGTSKVVFDRLIDEKNKGNDQVYNEFFVKYRRDSYTKKTVILDKEKVWIPPAERGPDGAEYTTKYVAKLIDTDRNSVDRVLLNKWREEGVRKQVIETDGTVIQRKANVVSKDFQEFKTKFTDAKTKKNNLPYTEVKDKLDSILKTLGVDVPIQLWDELEALKPGEKYAMVQDWMFGLRKHSLEDLISKYLDGVDPFSGSNLIDDLATKSIGYVEDLSRGAYLNESGDQEYPNNTPSYITEFINNAKQNPDDITSKFQQDEFYNGNAFLGVIKDKASRSTLALEFTSSIREGEKDPKDFQNRSEIESLIMRFTAYHNNAGDNAFYNVGTPADKTKQPMLALPKYKGTRAKDFLLSVLNRNIENESVRIQRLKKYTERGNQPLPIDIKNLKDAVKFIYVPDLNSIPNLAEQVSSGSISPKEKADAIKSAQGTLEKFIANEYELFLQYLEDNDLVKTKKGKDGTLEVASVTDKMPEGIMYDHKGQKSYSVEAFLKEFFYNDLAWRFEVSKVLQGDLAFYSSQDDYFKRQYQLVTPGYKPVNSATLTRGVYGKQFKKNVDKFLLDVSKEYANVNKTDAQSLATMDAYRTLAGSLGQWTKDHETLYQFAWREGIPVRKAASEALKRNAISEEQANEYRSLASKTLIQPLKPFVFRDVIITLPDGKKMLIKEQVKDSITTISPEFSNVSQGYKDLVAYMYSNNIDIMSAEDTIKVGLYGVINDFSRPAAEWEKRKFDIQDFKFPQFIPDAKKEEVSGTQTHKLILGNIDPDTVYIVAGKEVTGKKLIANYSELWLDKIEASAKKLKKELGLTENGLLLSEDPKKRTDQLFKLHLLLKRELGEREVNDNYHDLLDLVKRGAEQVDFTIPISFPAFGPKFQSILTNLWKKNVIKQKSPGYSAVNLADFGVGYSDELKFLRQEDGKIVEAEIGLPIEYVSDIGLKYGEHILPNGTILWDKLSKNQQESLQFILYRIPTSNKSSMVPVRVVRITPPHLNNIVMIPGELTVQQGLDFDVDKSQLIRRVLNKEGKVDSENTDTKLFELYWSILTNPAHLEELLTPLASPTMKTKLEGYRASGVVEAQEKSSPLSVVSDVQAEVRNKDAQAQIGIASRFNTGHTVLQTINDYVAVTTSIDITHKGKKFDFIGGKFDADGNLISTNHAESQQAALDAAKDPLLAYFNVVKGTTAAFHTMLEFGIPLGVAIDFFMQPVLKEWTKFYKHEGQSISKATEKLFQTYPGIKAQYDIIDKDKSKYPLSSEALANSLLKSISESNEHSARVLIEFLNVVGSPNQTGLANQMTNINNVISVDTFQDMTGLESLQSFIEQRTDATNQDASIYIDPRVFDLESTPAEGKRLAAFFKYGIDEAIGYISQFYPSASEEYQQMRDHYASLTGEESVKDKRLTKKLNQFTDYFLMQYDSSLFRALTLSHPLFSEDPAVDKSDYRNRWSFFDPNRSIWKYINKLVEGHPELQKNALLKNLETSESRQNELQVIGVRNTDAQGDKTDYINAWWTLLNHADPEIKTLGHDLVRYAIQTSGFMYSIRSFYDLIPIQFWVEKGIASQWDSITKNPKIDVEADVVSFIRHNFRSLDRFPEIYTRNIGGQLQSDAILNTKQVGKHLREFNVKKNYKENQLLPRFFRIFDWQLNDYRLYESSIENDRYFKEVQPLGGRGYIEVKADRVTSDHSKVRAQYPNISPNPWGGRREFPLYGNSNSYSNPYIQKYIPQEAASIKTVLENLLLHETDVEAKKGIEAMLRNSDPDKLTTHVEIDSSITGKLGVLRVDQEGYAVVKINPNSNIESDTEMRHVLIHELTHAFSIGVIRNPKGENEVNFVRNLNRIYTEAKANSKIAGEYALTNVEEFIAELASSVEFRKKLRRTDLWSRILRAFRKLFGLKDQYDKVLDQYYDVLDQAEDLQRLNPGEFALVQEEKEIKGSKRIGVLQQMLSSLQARERDLRKRWKRTEANDLQKERKILENLVASDKNQAIVRYLIHTEKEVNQLKELFNTLSKDLKKIDPAVLNSMRDQLISYDILHTLTDRIYDHPEDFIPEGGDKEVMLKQLNQLSADVSRLSKKVERLGIKRFATFIKEALSDPNLTIESIEDNLTVADRDIVWSARWTDPALDVEDPSIKAIAKRLKDNEAQAYRKTQEDLYSKESTPREVEITLLEPSATSTKMYWKKRKIKYKSTGFFKALEEYEQWLKRNKPKSDSFADKFSRIIDPNSKTENEDGVHFISPFTTEGRAILSIKEESADYPLRQFYETIVLGYLKSQEEIAEYSLRPGLRLPSIGRGLMEGFLREKGIKNTASMFTEQFLNNFRERFDDRDYQPVDQSGRPRQDVALRFTSKQDGQEGRLNTREVSLDIANTIPLFIHEMHSRKGLVQLRDDLEIGKSILANRKVLKTKAIEGKGLTPYLTRERDNITLASGEFDSISGRESKSFELYDALVRRFVYGQYKAREGTIKAGSFKASVAKSVDALLRFTGAKLMIFNVAIPLTNYVGTEATFMKEVVGSNIINAKNWLAGQKVFAEAALAAVQDLGRREKKTRFGRIFTYFNPMDTERPVTNIGVDSNWMRTILHKVASSGSDVFEYKLAVNAMGAVMDRFKITNPEGKEVSMLEGLEVTKDGKVSLMKGYKYNGSNELKGETIDQIIQYTLRLYQSATGVRNRMDTSAASEFVVGRLVTFMRNWLKSGLNARYKTKHFDEKIMKENEGHYISSLILFNNIFGREGWVKNMVDSLKVLVFMNQEDPKLLLLPEELKLSEDRQNEIIQLRQANIRKSAFELYAIMALSMLLWFGWDDDEDNSYLRYMSARVRRELMTFIDVTTAWDVLRSPTIALNTIEGFQRISSSMIGSMGAVITGDDQPIYEAGPFKDQYKLSADLERQFFPFRKQFKALDTKTSLIVRGYR